jgi:hypothetical protein
MSDEDSHRAVVDLQSRLPCKEHTLETLDAAVAADRLSRRIEGALGEARGRGALPRD